jgi:peptide/nickel transport system substrate-binding protein
LNYSKYNKPKVDKLLNDTRLEGDPAKRKVLYDNIMNIIHKNVPYIYLYHPNNVFGFSKSVQGFNYVPDGMIRTVSLSKN